jgi:hypothetical protein
MTASVKRGGTNGQISLGKEFAGRIVLIESIEPRGVADQDDPHHSGCGVVAAPT